MKIIKKIDFLTTPPEMCIFNKPKNKTFSGGLLFLLFLIFMILYALDNALNFFLNEKYDIEANRIQKIISKEESDRLNDNSEYNPNISYACYLWDSNERKNLSNNFMIYNEKKKELIKRKTMYTERANNISLWLLYRCKDQRCLIEKSDEDEFYYKFIFYYTGSEVDHENNKNPLQTQNIKMKIPFYFNNPTVSTAQWLVVKYSDRKTFSLLWNKIRGLDKYYIGGFFNSIDTYLRDKNGLTRTIDGNLYKVLSFVSFQNPHFELMEYKRKFKSILDVIIDVGSLFLTIFSAFKSIFYFHTVNYSNYEIVKKLILKEKNQNLLFNDKNIEKKNKKIKKIELENELENMNSKLINNSDTVEESNDKIKPLNNSEEDRFQKVCCLSYILNPFYCDCCKCCSSSQNFLNKCNEIVYKYLSVDNILYNQMMLENLFNDYVWHNPDLKKIDNINLIEKLKDKNNSTSF